MMATINNMTTTERVEDLAADIINKVITPAESGSYTVEDITDAIYSRPMDVISQLILYVEYYKEQVEG